MGSRSSSRQPNSRQKKTTESDKDLSPEELKAIADRFSKQGIVQKHLRPFACGSWVDPLALWSLERIGDRQIKWLIILLDWMFAKQAEQDAGDLEK